MPVRRIPKEIRDEVIAQAKTNRRSVLSFDKDLLAS